MHDGFELINSYDGMFVKSYRLGEINYLTASEDEQGVLLTRWRGILNSISNNCEFAITFERAHVRVLLNLSDSVMDFVTNAPRGQGIIYTGTSAVPFYAAFPKDNDIYRAITLDMKEIMAYKEKEARERVKLGKG